MVSVAMLLRNLGLRAVPTLLKTVEGEVARGALSVEPCPVRDLVCVLASGSLSRRIRDNNDALAAIHTISDDVDRQVDLRGIDL